MPETKRVPPWRVLQVIRPAAGGMRHHLTLLCTGLAQRGITVEVAAPQEFAWKERTGILLHSVTIAPRPHLVHDLRAGVQIARLAQQADLIHAHGLRGAWIGSIATRFIHKPLIVTAHNLAPSHVGNVARALLRSAIRRICALIAVSHSVAESLIRSGLKHARITVIPNGIDLAPFDFPLDRAVLLRDLHLPAGARIVVAVGRLSPEKGFDTLITAAPQIMSGDPSIYLLLAGEGPERARLEAQVQRCGVEDRCHLLGYYQDIPDLLRSSEVVVIPSVVEGQGLVALEAMAACKPVVASRVGGLTETVREGVTGLLVPPNDPGALAQALQILLADEALRRRMGTAGRSLVEQEYRVDRMVEQTLALYRCCMAR